jgi:hypothetical protein
MKRLSLFAVIVAIFCALSGLLSAGSVYAFPAWEPVFKADCSTNTKLNSVCVNTTNQTVCVGTGAACQATSGGVQGPDGAAGTNGAKWYVGAGAPVGGTGIDGDFYLRTNGDVYGPKIGGAWGAVVGSLLGATGSQGPQGIQGDPGPQGDQGIQGIQGLQGEQGIQGIPGAGSTITVQEQDGAPTGSASTLKFPNASLTDDGGGAFSVTFSASDTIGWDYTALAAEPGTPIVGKVYRANNEAGGWDPITYAGTTDYFVMYTGSAWVGITDINGNLLVSSVIPTQVPWQRDIHIPAPAATDVVRIRTTKAITLSEIGCIVDPADSSESGVVDVQECNADGDSCVTVLSAPITCGNTNTTGTVTDTALAANVWLLIDLGTVTGTVSDASIYLRGTETQ